MSTQFNTEYVASLLFSLLASYGISKASPNLNPAITYGVVPLAVAYTSIHILNAVVPGLNKTGAKVSAYVENKTLGEINNMGYIQIFPPLLAISVLVVVLLFTKNL
jgi:hypothetical protein